uniref:Cadherin domain-containing protein n=1 Tax=Sinocyclocheilus anshuiensis TaxID=1608454 RepID=A0A671RFF8_9TELE
QVPQRRRNGVKTERGNKEEWLSQLHFSVPEEQERGTVVGNIAEDLGLDITKLSARRFQTVPSARTPYLEVNLENGALVVNERIDREEICRQTVPCLLHLEVFLENPLELFRVEIEVMDINDNPPSFPETDITVEITESTRAVSAAVAKRAGARRSSVNRTLCSSRALTWPAPHRCRWRSRAASARTTKTRTTATRYV